MIRFDKSDKILANIAKVIEKRLRNDSIDLTIAIDKELSNLESKIENRVIIKNVYCLWQTLHKGENFHDKNRNQTALR